MTKVIWLFKNKPVFVTPCDWLYSSTLHLMPSSGSPMAPNLTWSRRAGEHVQARIIEDSSKSWSLIYRDTVFGTLSPKSKLVCRLFVQQSEFSRHGCLARMSVAAIWMPLLISSLLPTWSSERIWGFCISCAGTMCACESFFLLCRLLAFFAARWSLSFHVTTYTQPMNHTWQVVLCR